MKDTPHWVSRRRFLARLAALPGLAWLAGCQAPPNRSGLRDTTARPKVDVPKRQVAVRLSELPEDWSHKDIEYRYVDETSAVSGSVVRASGYAVKLPADVAGADAPRVALFSRICTHLSCNLNYVPPDQRATLVSKYNFRTAKPGIGYLACPCHFSCFDLSERDHVGRLGTVQGGPAPRAPRVFTFHVEGDDVVVTGMEPGGIA